MTTHVSNYLTLFVIPLRIMPALTKRMTTILDPGDNDDPEPYRISLLCDFLASIHLFVRTGAIFLGFIMYIFNSVINCFNYEKRKTTWVSQRVKGYENPANIH